MSDPYVPSCSGVGSIIALDHVSKTNFDKINAGCWMKSSLITDEKFFRLVKLDEQRNEPNQTKPNHTYT